MTASALETPPKRLCGLRFSLRQLLKETIWLPVRHRPGVHRPLCLFATRRGGSTWLMETMAACRGVRYMDQPFSLFTAGGYHASQLPYVDYSQFIDLDPIQEPQVRTFLEDLFAGRLAVNAPWEVWSPAFDFVSDRVLLKITDAKALIDWIDQSFEVDVLYLLRHPIPTALSIIRNGWILTAPAYLTSERFREEMLTDEQVTFSLRILASGTLLQQHVLNWALENLRPLRLLPERPHWHVTSYEETILNPEAVIDALAQTFGLDGPERMKRQVHRASRSTRRLSSRYDPQADPIERLTAWKKRVDPAEQEACYAILDRLGIPVYTADDLRPHLDVCS